MSENILEKLNWRYATKAFDPAKKVSEADWRVLEDALTLAPSSFGLQPYKFIVVTDPAVREKLKAAAWGQPQVTDASHLVVFAYKKSYEERDVNRFFDRISEVRGQSRESLIDYEKAVRGSVQKASDGGYLETWNSRQVYIAIGFLLETAALMEIDAIAMEGFDPAQFNEILGLEDYSAVAVAAIGYRDAEKDWLVSLPKVRFPKEELIERV